MGQTTPDQHPPGWGGGETPALSVLSLASARGKETSTDTASWRGTGKRGDAEHSPTSLEVVGAGRFTRLTAPKTHPLRRRSAPGRTTTAMLHKRPPNDSVAGGSHMTARKSVR